MYTPFLILKLVIVIIIVSFLSTVGSIVLTITAAILLSLIVTHLTDEAIEEHINKSTRVTGNIYLHEDNIACCIRDHIFVGRDYVNNLAVIAHELGHSKNNDTNNTQTFNTYIMLSTGLLASYSIPLCAVWFVLTYATMSLRDTLMEYRADDCAVYAGYKDLLIITLEVHRDVDIAIASRIERLTK